MRPLRRVLGRRPLRVRSVAPHLLRGRARSLPQRCRLRERCNHNCCRSAAPRGRTQPCPAPSAGRQLAGEGGGRCMAAATAAAAAAAAVTPTLAVWPPRRPTLSMGGAPADQGRHGASRGGCGRPLSPCQQRRRRRRRQALRRPGGGGGSADDAPAGRPDIAASTAATASDAVVGAAAVAAAVAAAADDAGRPAAGARRWQRRPASATVAARRPTQKRFSAGG